jgi:hypothetical protein
VNPPAATATVYVASPLGVNVAVYVVPDPEMAERLPPDTATSAPSKSVVLSLAVKVSVNVPSFVVDPADTLEPLESSAVIVITGAVVSSGDIFTVTTPL